MKTFLSFVFALTFAASWVRAEDVLEIPETCGTQTELTREIAALRASSRSGLSTERPPVRLTHDGDGYVLSVALPDGRRLLRDPDCRALFRAAIVIAALGHESSVENVLGASEAGRASEESDQPTREVAKAAAAKPAPADPTRASEARAAASVPVAPVQRERDARTRALEERRLYPRELGMRALLRAELAYGVVPGLSGIFGAGIALEYGRFSARTVFAYQGPPRSHSSGDEGVRVEALTASLTLEIVALPWLRPGIGADFDALHGRGLGVSSPQSAWATQATLHAGVSLRMLKLGAFWLELAARGLWAPEPARFLMRGRSPVYTASPWGIQGGINASYQFL
jgi:hypothetical protein